jgi:hypothetical protein
MNGLRVLASQSERLPVLLASTKLAPVRVAVAPLNMPPLRSLWLP